MVVIQGSVFLEKYFDNNLHNDVLLWWGQGMWHDIGRSEGIPGDI
jgi:hypothetical protein